MRYQDEQDEDDEIDPEDPDASDQDDSDVDDDARDEIDCPYCGKPVAEFAEICPHCRNYISHEDAPPSPKSRWKVAVVLWLVAVFSGLLLFQSCRR